MDDFPKISVIMPIYNVADFLHKSLNSVRAQTFKDYEVIMVEGGSTDESHEIAAYYAERHSRFHLLVCDSPNVGIKRNMALKAAKGEYIAFVDSDDFIEPNYLEKLYNAAKENDSDVIVCNYSIYNPITEISKPISIRKPRAGEMKSSRAVSLTLRDFQMRSYLWNKFWKRDLFFDNNIIFPDIYFEDIATVSRLLYYANKVFVIDDCLYHYTKRTGSIIHSLSDRKIDGYIYALGILRCFFEMQGFEWRYKFPMLNLGVCIFFSNWYSVVSLHWKEKKFKGLFSNIHRSNKKVMHFIFGKMKKSEVPINTEKRIIIF